MVTREELIGHWNEVKGRLREQWGELTEDDLQRARGSADQLVGVVQQRTGATKAEVEAFIDRVFEGSTREQLKERVDHYAEAAQRFAGDAATYVNDGVRRAGQQSGYYAHQLTETIKARPKESLAIAFGVGIAAGALLFRGKEK